MLTIHAARTVRYVLDDPAPLADAAIVVSGDRIAEVGPLDEMRERFPGARVRQWPGVLGPALVHEGALPDAPTPRERVHALLRLGATAWVPDGPVDDVVRAAAARAGVVLLPRARRTAVIHSGRADLAVFTADGGCVATVLAGRVVHRRA